MVPRYLHVCCTALMRPEPAEVVLSAVAYCSIQHDHYYYAEKGYCSKLVCRSVSLSVCPHVFSQTVTVLDTKREYVGRCNRRAAQQESGAALSKHGIFTWGPKIVYGYYTRCALIRDHQLTEQSYSWKVSTLGNFRWL